MNDQNDLNDRYPLTAWPDAARCGAAFRDRRKRYEHRDDFPSRGRFSRDADQLSRFSRRARARARVTIESRSRRYHRNCNDDDDERQTRKGPLPPRTIRHHRRRRRRWCEHDALVDAASAVAQPASR